MKSIEVNLSVNVKELPKSDFPVNFSIYDSSGMKIFNFRADNKVSGSIIFKAKRSEQYTFEIKNFARKLIYGYKFVL